MFLLKHQHIGRQQPASLAIGIEIHQQPLNSTTRNARGIPLHDRSFLTQANAFATDHRHPGMDGRARPGMHGVRGSLTRYPGTSFGVFLGDLASQRALVGGASAQAWLAASWLDPGGLGRLYRCGSADRQPARCGDPAEHGQYGGRRNGLGADAQAKPRHLVHATPVFRLAALCRQRHGRTGSSNTGRAGGDCRVRNTALAGFLHVVEQRVAELHDIFTHCSGLADTQAACTELDRALPHAPRPAFAVCHCAGGHQLLDQRSRLAGVLAAGSHMVRAELSHLQSDADHGSTLPEQHHLHFAWHA